MERNCQKSVHLFASSKSLISYELQITFFFLKLAPTFIWNQMDILVFFDASAALAIYVTLLCTQPIADKFQLYIDESGKVFIGKKGRLPF